MKILWFIPHTPRIVSDKLGIPKDNRAGWFEGLIEIIKRSNNKYVLCNISTTHPDIYDDNIVYTSLGNQKILHPFKRHPLSSSTAADRQLLEVCKFVIERHEPDVIHIHGTENPLGLLSKDYDIPLIISLQGIMNAIYPRYYYGFNFIKVLRASISTRSIKSILLGSGPVWNKLKMKKDSNRERKIFRLCSTFLGKTDFDRAYTTALNPKARYIRVPIILRPVTTQGKWSVKSRESYCIFCLTSAHVFKGIGVLLNAFTHLSQSGFRNIKLRIGGRIFPEIKYLLKKTIYADHLNCKIEFLGGLSYEEVDKEFLNCDISVMPSYIENEPNSLFEAMRLGVPCISSSVGGIPSFFSHGNELLFFNPGSHLELAGLIENLLTDRILSNALSTSSLEWFKIRKRLTEQDLDEIYTSISQK